MHIVKECDKRINAFHLGEQDARNGKVFNKKQVKRSDWIAYKNGYILGQQFRKNDTH